MATYSTIKGFTVQSLSSDPYASVEASGTWASGNTTNTGRRGVGGLGSQTAAIAACGDAPPVGVLCESYNGTTWSEVNDLSTARTSVGASGGSQTAGLVAGGNAPGGDVANVEKFDGTNWTEVGDLNQIRHGGACMGATNTAAIYSGGSNYPPGTGSEGYLVETESWNGSAWTEVGDLNSGRRYVAGAGPSGAAFLLGGYVPSTSTAATEMWNGSSWTTSTSFNTARNYLAGSGGANAQTGALVYGGQPGTQAITEAWNGSSWTEVGDMGVGKKSFLGSTLGTTSLALSAFGGPPNPTASEEWTTASPPISVAQEGQVWYNTTSTVLKGYIATAGTGSWASGGNLNTARSLLFSFGQSNSTGIAASGYTSTGNTANCESYNGSAWTEVNNVNSAYREPGGSFGTQTAGIKAGGRPPDAVDCESWDGTNWTEVNNLTSAKTDSNSGAGTQTSGLIAGGDPASTNVQTWDGTNWATGTSMNTGRQYIGRAGSSDSAAMSFGGGTPGVTANSETWDGSSWTEGNNLNTARQAVVGGGPVTMAMCMAGQTPTPTGIVEQYNGTSWTEVADLSVTRYGPGGTSNAPGTEMLCYGGYQPSYKNETEEWTQPTPLAIKTFTSS